MNFGQPAAKLFFQRDDRRRDMRVAAGQQAAGQVGAARMFVVPQRAEVVGVEQDHDFTRRRVER